MKLKVYVLVAVVAVVLLGLLLWSGVLGRKPAVAQSGSGDTVAALRAPTTLLAAVEAEPAAALPDRQPDC